MAVSRDLLEALKSLRPSRDLPWRYVGDPWAALLAEVLLVRTNASKVAAFYPAILSRLRAPCDAASLPLGELESLLRPLGLWRRRAEMLRRIAEAARRLGCSVPCDYTALRSLPGVGDYAAAAVLLSACGARPPGPPVDVNVARVLSRAALGRDPRADYLRDRELLEVASSLPWTRELLYALLDVSALHCRPSRPRCASCPLRAACRYAAGQRGH